MHPKSALSLIQDELDSRQIVVKLHLTAFGVVIVAQDLASRLIAKAELKRQGIAVVE